MWEIDRVREQQAEHAARRADGRVDAAGHRCERELRQRGADHAHGVVDDVATLAEHALDRAAEHVEREHVEAEMEQAAVQECIRHELPRREAHLAAGRRGAANGHRASGISRPGKSTCSR